MNVEIPEKFAFLFEPARYKVGYGGRAGVKSWSFARALLTLGRIKPLRIACARETMQSIKDSVHQLLEDQIRLLGMDAFYEILKAEVRGRNGTQFTFHGLRDQSVHNIKSLEGADVLWVEEAQNVTRRSWLTVIPTIRKAGSEIWVSFNPELETDETYQRFVVHPPPGAVVVKTSYADNPYLSEEIRADIEHLRLTEPAEYAHVYEGACRQVVEGSVYKEQIVNAELEGRFSRVAYDPVRPVHTFWDLGFGDNVSIWFAQSIGMEFRLIDFVSDHLKDVGFYLKEMRSRNYSYGTCWLPHDARAKTLAAGGRSIQQLVEAGGFHVSIVPQLSVEDGIAAARTIFNRCWFDQEKCGDGIQALKHYRYEQDESMSTHDHPVFKRNPLHDWASHPADAFRYFAVAIREPDKPQKPTVMQPAYYGSNGWMA